MTDQSLQGPDSGPELPREPATVSVQVVDSTTRDPVDSPEDAVGEGGDGGRSSAALADGPEMFRDLDILGHLKAAQSATLTVFQRQVSEHGPGWVERHLPRVRGALQAESKVVLDDALLIRCGETRAFWSGAESRMTECSRCEAPHAPPRCLQSDAGVSPGVVVRLRLVGPTLEHSTVERKLSRAGVPQRLVGQRLQRIDNLDVLAKATRAFEHVIECVRGRKEVTLLIQGKLCREYGAALLAECVAAQAVSMTSLHVPTFVRSERVAMATRSNEGLIAYASTEVLLIDALEPLQLETKHWLDEILWLIEARRDKGFVTIVTTTILKPTLKDTFPGSLSLFVEKKK